MEALVYLEQTQRILSLMQSHNISSNHHHDSDRFLADFFLFLAKPCGALDLEKKCSLISDFLPKISPTFVDEVLVSLNKEDQKISPQHPTRHCFDYKSSPDPTGCAIEDMPMVGLDAMQRANSTLEDFCRSYFMFHGMDVNKPESIFRYLPVLSFTEGYIYQLDTLNEEASGISKKIGTTSTYKVETRQRLKNDLKVLKDAPLRPLILLLECQTLLTERIREELTSGEEYWALERKLCHALVSRKEVSIEDVIRAIHLKSFDYRVLNLLLYQLRESQVNEMHMEFLSISEFLVEISDDLFDYEEDVMENNFNVLRMFVGVYGASTAPVMLAKCIAEAEDKYEHLLNTLDPGLSSRYRRRCEEATKEGGSRSGDSLGTWSIPHVITDEEFYRSERLSSKSGEGSSDCAFK
ncbi:hypothetical protein ACHQM5_023533 [Ranunculus cassubicifolius]